MKNKNLFIIVLIMISTNSITSCKKKETPAPIPTPTPTSTYSIGQSYGGGIVFYIDGTGLHGLIATASDQSDSAQWGNGTQTIATGNAVGTGQANTTAIINTLGSGGNYAANVCDQLVLNGYSDWFLPSKDELNLLYQQKTAVGGFGNNGYWSSSVGNNANSWYQYFYNGYQDIHFKYDPWYVRAVRAF